MKGEYPPGATPLTPEEEDGLIPQHITLRTELNEFEQANILEAETWLLNRRSVPPVTESAFLKELHRRMFGRVWKWAGDYRKTDRNLGVHWPKISLETETLCREVDYWRNEQVAPGSHAVIGRIEHLSANERTAHEPQEIGAFDDKGFDLNCHLATSSYSSHYCQTRILSTLFPYADQR